MSRASAVVLALLLQSSLVLGDGHQKRSQEGDWSSSQQVLDLRLEAPLRELFAKSQDHAGYEVIGRLSYLDPATRRQVEIEGVQISTRGHTSREANECDFPKLKLTFKPAGPEGSILSGTGSLKLGTHCADRPDEPLTPKFGRLANEKAPYREALVYQLLHAAGIPTLQARPARITYAFTDTDAPESGQPPLVRNALLLEDDKEAMSRLGATSRLTEDRFDTARSTFDETDTARLSFAQAMVGNFDWCLRVDEGDHYRCNDRHPLWNILGLGREDGWTAPLIYDFDLAGIVAGRHGWFTEMFDESFLPSGSRLEIAMLAQLQRTRSLFSRPRLDSTRQYFRQRKGALYRAVEDSTADGEGKALAATHLDTFFALIESDDQFYRPVIAGDNVQAHPDSRTSEPVCGDRNTIPAGTPVTAPLDSEGDMIRVRLLDVMWHWTPEQRCDAIHREPVWIPRSAVTSRYPR
jgi:hypothetical protein